MGTLYVDAFSYHSSSINVSILFCIISRHTSRGMNGDLDTLTKQTLGFRRGR
jgi:hypothetical protein